MKYLCLEAGDLFSKISSVTYQLTEEKCKKFVLEITKALKYIHDRNIIHLDLKPANIMMKNKTEYFKVTHCPRRGKVKWRIPPEWGPISPYSWRSWGSGTSFGLTGEVVLFDFLHLEVFFQGKIFHMTRNRKIAMVPPFFLQSECLIWLFISKLNQKTESVSKKSPRITKKFLQPCKVGKLCYFPGQEKYFNLHWICAGTE